MCKCFGNISQLETRPLIGLRIHTASEPSVRFTSMNPACGVENIKLYYINNKKCHFSK